MLQPSDFSYHLPPELIASRPSPRRDHCRLLLLDRQTGQVTHSRFFHLSELLRPDDVLVFNQSKVFPARIFGRKSTGGHLELLLLHQTSPDVWTAISSPRPKINQILNFDQHLSAKVLSSHSQTGEIEIKFNQTSPQILQTLDQIGQTPLPPYIHSSASETRLRADYQTVYARDLGSAAAPTAGLHFTPELLASLRSRGIQTEFLTLHVGLGTFQPLRSQNLIQKKLHSENFSIDSTTASRLLQAKKSGRRIIAVGTTTLRALESWALHPQAATTDIFIFPPYRFRFVDSLITNFHLPQSSLLMLVTAFTSSPNSPHIYRSFRDTIIYSAYQSAISHRYRFFSFGDAMWIF